MKLTFVAFPLLLILSTYAAGQTAGGAAESASGPKDEEEIRKVSVSYTHLTLPTILRV